MQPCNKPTSPCWNCGPRRVLGPSVGMCLLVVQKYAPLPTYAPSTEPNQNLNFPSCLSPTHTLTLTGMGIYHYHPPQARPISIGPDPDRQPWAVPSRRITQ